jgi:hypothetical protein
MAGPRIPRQAPRVPKWLNDLMIAEDAARLAPPPTLDDIIARLGDDSLLPGSPTPPPRPPEASLERMAYWENDPARRAERAVDRGYSREENIFGLPVKTMQQGRSLGERNLPGIENLSPEDQLAVAAALDKGAMLRAMPAASEQQYLRTKEMDRAFKDTSPNPFLIMPESSQADVLRSLQNKRDYERMGGMNYDLPPPAAFYKNDAGRVRPSTAIQTLGDDVTELAQTIRQDQIDSRLLSAGEAADAQAQATLDRVMRESADAVAAREAYARQYGGFPPDTVREMDRGTNSLRMRQSGQMDRMLNDPLLEIQRTPTTEPESYSDYWAREYGNPMLKGAALGHVLSYPLVYGIYKGMTPGELNTAEPTPPARSIGLEASMEDEPIALKAMAAKADDNIDDLVSAIPIEVDDMPLVTMPMDEVGVADDPVEDMTFLESNTEGAPASDELDALLIAAGLNPAATSRKDIVSMEADGARVDSLYPPESVEYQMEMAHRNRTGRKPYPALSY